MGNGQANFDTVLGRYLVDLRVAARYDAIAAGDVVRWRSSFEHASQILFEASEGQFQLGTIRFINASPIADEDDIGLETMVGSSYTVDPDTPFGENVVLMEHVRSEPLEILHELGHYVATLGEEYNYIWPNTVLRRCRNDASTGECIMEFASGFGLRLDPSGGVSPVQPANIVSRYCSDQHIPFGNGQHNKHGESCWQTWQRLYSFLQPLVGTAPSSIPQTVQWMEDALEFKYALAVPADDTLAHPAIEQAIKSAMKEWALRVSMSGGQLAIAMGQSGLLRKMQPLTLDELSKLLSEIDAVHLKKSSTDQVSLAGTLAQFDTPAVAFQRLVVMAAGNSQLDVSSLPRGLPQHGVTMLSRTLGQGPLAGALATLSSANKWVRHETMPVPAQSHADFAFSVQNELLETYFSGTPGYGLADWRRGLLPSTTTAPPTERNADGIDSASGMPGVPLQHEQRAWGQDWTVWVEQGAESVTFELSQWVPGALHWELIAPDGKQTFSPRPRFDQHRHILSLDTCENISGRWILRLRRRQAGPALPYFALAAVKNPVMATRATADVKGQGRVEFRIRVTHRLVVDLIEASVDVIPFLPDRLMDGLPVLRVPLQRERALDPVGGQSLELSTGLYTGSASLAPGAYVAVFRAINFGQAVVASNPGRVLDGDAVLHSIDPIPAFSRVEKHHFQISH